MKVEDKILHGLLDHLMNAPPVVCGEALMFWYSIRYLFLRLRFGFLQVWNPVIDLRMQVERRSRRESNKLEEPTWAIAMYSTMTEATFIPKLTKIATSVDMPSMKAMKRGPISLQVRSIRLICAFITRLWSVRYTAPGSINLTS